MAFPDLASLPPAAVAAVAQTCEALITAEGQEQATPRERQRGAATTGPIRDFHRDFWPWIERPLADVRRDLHVLPATGAP